MDLSEHDGLLYLVPYIADAQERAQVAYTIQTRHGQLLLVFVPGDRELPSFTEFAAATLKPGYVIRITAVVASSVSEVGKALKEEGLIPSSPTRLVEEGTPFFDQVIRELEDDTIWPEH